ncbi:MAG: RidA family protein [Peptococcaceae bacterium]|nr:RidA family protein [Peptococcaceae bacterium]
MIEDKLKKLGFELPPVPQPVASYVPAMQAGNLVFTSGQLPLRNGEMVYRGRVGEDVSTEEGQEAARLCVLNCLAAIKGLIGNLENVVQVVKVTGFVNSAPGFSEQPRVINGASDLLQEIYGENGRHARAAVGVAALPLNASVELEMVVAVK